MTLAVGDLKEVSLTVTIGGGVITTVIIARTSE